MADDEQRALVNEYTTQDMLLRKRFKEIGITSNGMVTLERMRRGWVLISMTGLQCSILARPDSYLDGALNALIEQRDRTP